MPLNEFHAAICITNPIQCVSAQLQTYCDALVEYASYCKDVQSIDGGDEANQKAFTDHMAACLAKHTNEKARKYACCNMLCMCFNMLFGRCGDGGAFCSRECYSSTRRHVFSMLLCMFITI